MSGHPESEKPEQHESNPAYETVAPERVYSYPIIAQSAEEVYAEQAEYEERFRARQAEFAERAEANRDERWDRVKYPFPVEEIEYRNGHQHPDPDHMNYLIRQAIPEYLRFLDAEGSDYDLEAYQEWYQSLWDSRPQARIAAEAESADPAASEGSRPT